MKITKLNGLWNFKTKIIVLCISTGLTSISPCFAQSNITPDNTLGNEASEVTPNINNRDGVPSELIEGGAQRGQNLFHSLQEFNVNEGRGAYFVAPNDIQNILTRVTGNNASAINGILGTILNRNFDPTNANLFLINPNGIIFGRNASLDVNGSFLGTTANGIEFGERGLFSAANPEAPSGLLTVNPNAFLFSQIKQRAEIRNNSDLRVADGKSLLLLGSPVSIDGGELLALGGRVELGGLAAPGTVGLNTDGNSLSLSFPDGVARSDVTLNNGTGVNVRGGNDGNIAINSRNLDIIEGSQLFAGIASGLGSPETQAGNIKINATATVVIDGVTNGFRSGVFNETEANSVGNSGKIDISAGSVEIKNGAQLDTGTLGRGDSGKIQINAADKVVFDGAPFGFQSSALSQVGENAVGNSGEIEINADNVEVTNGAFLDASTLGEGNAGKIRITSGKVVFDGESPLGFRSSVFSQVGQNAVGNSGGIEINADNVEVTNGGQLNAITLGRGNAGSIKITGSDKVVFDGESMGGFRSSAFSQVGTDAVGDSGGIVLKGGNVEITNGALLDASTLGQGNAGAVQITGSNKVVFDGESMGGFRSSALSQVGAASVGDSGGIVLEAGNVEITNGALLDASTLGQGNAGAVKITGDNKVVFDGESNGGSRTSAFSQVGAASVGDSGGIVLEGGNVEITNGALLDASTLGQGNAGAVKITGRERVVFDGKSNSGNPSSASSQVATEAEGNSGGSVINTSTFELTNGAQLTTSTLGTGNAGAINITATDKVVLDGKSRDGSLSSAATSEVGALAAGNSEGIQINTPTLKLSDTGLISTNTLGNGQAGNITVDSINLDLTEGSQISAQSTGNGRAGNININIKDNFNADNGQVITQAERTTGGNIDITGKNIILRNNSDINTTLSTTEGSGGNITLSANAIVALEDSDILAFAPQGTGGNIRFNTDAFLSEPLFRPRPQNADPLTAQELDNLDGNNRVDVDASGSISSGTVSGQTDASFLEDSLIELPRNQIDTEALIARTCVVRSERNNNTFYIIGAQGFPYRPGDPVPSKYPAIEVQPVPDEGSSSIPRRRWKIGDPIVEPNGVYTLVDGRRILSRECGT